MRPIAIDDRGVCHSPLGQCLLEDVTMRPLIYYFSHLLSFRWYVLRDSTEYFHFVRHWGSFILKSMLYVKSLVWTLAAKARNCAVR